MKIAICTTHFTPALAVIEVLKKRHPDLEILFFGRKKTFSSNSGVSLESKTLQRLKNVTYLNTISGRWQRFFDLKNILTPFLSVIGIMQSLYYLLKNRPGVILSFGGYSSVSVVIAGWLVQIPIISHEQTSTVGLATRINAHFSQKICLSWPESLNQFDKKKAILTGNPVRGSIIKSFRSEELTKFQGQRLSIVLVTGGNQGAHVINEAVSDILPWFLEKFTVVHQCGDYNNFQDEKKLNDIKNSLAKKLQERYFISSHINPDKMGEILKSCEIVIGRSGVNTVCELLYLRKKAVLIPLPFTAQSEQEKNAQILVKLGLGVMIKEDQLSPESLKKAVDILGNNKEKPNDFDIDKIAVLLKNAGEKISDVLDMVYDKKALH